MPGGGPATHERQHISDVRLGGDSPQSSRALDCAEVAQPLPASSEQDRGRASSTSEATTGVGGREEPGGDAAQAIASQRADGTAATTGQDGQGAGAEACPRSDGTDCSRAEEGSGGAAVERG